MKSARKSTQTPSDNPFQAKWAVLTGAKRQRPSAAAKRARRNVFADRRIGENDPTLDDDDRYLARLQRERTRRTKKRARFALPEEDLISQPAENTAHDRHPKSSLLRADDDEPSEEDYPVDDAEEQEQSDDEFLTLKAATTEENVGDQRPKTHQEIMDEVVLKSKMYKAKRQQEKHVADEQTEKLDEELPDIMKLLLKSSSDFSRNKLDRNVASLDAERASIFKEHDNLDRAQIKPTTPPLSVATPDKFSYEHVYQQLAAEKRSRPSDRLLTEQEQAQMEYEELQELERKRKDRMEDGGDSDEENSEDDVEMSGRREAGRGGRTKTKQLRAGADDLVDDFDLLAEDQGSSQGSDDDDGEPANGVLKRRASTGDNSAASLEMENELEPDTIVFHHEQEPADEVEVDIPFLFKDCPSSPGQLQKLFENRTLHQRQIVIERLRTCFAVSLNPSTNPAILGQLLQCLLLRIESLSKVSPRHLETAVAEIDMMLLQAYELGRKNDELQRLMCNWARDQLAVAFHSLTSTDALVSLSDRWGVSVLLILRAIGRLFPSSDLRHPVSTPLTLLLSEALALSRIVCSVDFATGCFVGCLLMEQMTSSGRYSGQLATFVTEVLRMACSPSISGPTEAFQEFRESDEKLSIRKLRLNDLFRKEQRDRGEEVILQGMVVHSALCLAEAVGMSGRIGHQDIVFEQIPLERLPKIAARTKLLQALVKSRASRVPLALYTKPAVAAARKSVNPKFSAESGVFRRVPRTSYHAARSGDVRQSAMRVRRALKKEERGMARDVRQAGTAKQVARANEVEERRERSEKRSKETMAFLESQQANWKKAEKRQRKLSGKKW